MQVPPLDATAGQQVLILPSVDPTSPSPSPRSAMKKSPLKKVDQNKLPRIQIDEDNMESIPDQIRSQLADQMARVIDLFKAVDEDGSGEITRKEFCKALMLCGLEREDAVNVFDCFDLDNNGSIEYKELSNLIQRSKKIHPKLSARQRALLPRLPTPPKKTGIFYRYPFPRPHTPKCTADPYTLVELKSSKWLPQKVSVLLWERTIGGWSATNRSTNKLAIVALPALGHEMLSEPIFTGDTFTLRPGQYVQQFPAGMLRSNFLLHTLADDGYSILAYESHTPGAEWQDQGEVATASLLAVLDYVASHQMLRYCRIALFTQGVGATAAFIAAQRAPDRVENRVKVIVACEPAEEAELLSTHMPQCNVPLLLISRAESQLCKSLHDAIPERVREQSNWIRVEEDHPQHDEEHFDCVGFLSDEPGAVLPFLHANVNVGRDPVVLLSPRGLSPRLTSTVKTFHLPPLSPRSPRGGRARTRVGGINGEGGVSPRVLS